MASKSYIITVEVAKINENIPNWRLRITTEGWAPVLTSISKKTPANPDEKHAQSTAINPIICLSWSASISVTFWLVALVLVSSGLEDSSSGVPLGIWTKATPRVRISNANHWTLFMCFLSSITENKAVVRILSWYVTWYVAASRLVNAMNSKLFCKQYKPLGTTSLNVSLGFPRISSLKALHDLLMEKPRWAYKLKTQTVNLQHSLSITAVEARYGRPGHVLEYLRSNTVAVVWSTKIINVP